MEDIDQALSADEPNRLVWRDKYSNGEYMPRWEHQYDNWYDKAGVTPAYLKSKCPNPSERLDQFLSSPFNTTGYRIQPSRPPSHGEKLGEEAYNPELSSQLREGVENYNMTVVRDAEADAYRNCRINIPESGLENTIRTLCDTKMCRDPVIIGNPESNQTVNLRVDQPADMSYIEQSILSEKEKEEYRYCANRSYYCRMPTGLSIPVSRVQNIHNSGQGECLFIAVAHYLRLAKATGFPDFSKPFKLASPYVYPWDIDSIMAYEAGNHFRQRAVRWLTDNGDEVIPNNKTVSHTMAFTMVNSIDIANIRSALMVTGQTIRAIYNGFVEQYPQTASALGLKSIKTDLRLKTVLDKMAEYITMYDTQDSDILPHIDLMIAYYRQIYIETIKMPDTYAGEIEIYALARSLGYNIHVWSSDGQKYHRLVYISYSPDYGSDTINVLTKQRYSKNGMIVGGGKHYEILYPAIKSKGPSTIEQFKKIYENTAVSDQHANIMIQQYIDIVLKTGAELSVQWLYGAIDQYKDFIDLPTILNGVHRLIVRSVPDVSASELAGLLGTSSDKELRLATKAFLKEYFGYGALDKCTYNEMLVSLAVGLGVAPEETVEENLAKLVEIEGVPDPETWRLFKHRFVIKLYSNYTSYMYKYHKRREYFGLDIFNNNNMTDYLLEFYRMSTFVDLK